MTLFLIETFTLTLTRGQQMPLIWVYQDAQQARFFSTLAASRGYHVKLTVAWEG